MDTVNIAGNNPEKEHGGEALQAYLRKYGRRIDDVKAQLIEETGKLGTVKEMQISPDEGEFLKIFVMSMRAKKGIEMGTFTGYSTLCFAQGLPADGKIIACDISDEWTKIGQKYWKLAGVEDKITLKIGPGLDTLKELNSNPAELGTFDFAFIDADKGNYSNYFDALFPLMRQGGVIIGDNAIWDGKVAKETENDPSTVAIRAYNEKVHKDARVEMVIMNIADGLSLAYKK